MATRRFPAVGAMLVAAPFVVLATDPIGTNVADGTPIRVPVVIMVVMVVMVAWTSVALCRLPRPVVMAA